MTNYFVALMKARDDYKSKVSAIINSGSDLGAPERSISRFSYDHLVGWAPVCLNELMKDKNVCLPIFELSLMSSLNYDNVFVMYQFLHVCQPELNLLVLIGELTNYPVNYNFVSTIILLIRITFLFR